MKRGFTLVELIVSLALVLILILGVNAVFKMASDTVNAGQALGAANRENRAVQSVLYGDFGHAMMADGPLLLIRSERVEAFRNRADELADRDGNPLTQDFDNNNREGENNVAGEATATLVYNARNHRVDSVSFFGRDLYQRQTGAGAVRPNSAAMLDAGSSTEAYIRIAHLDQPDFQTPDAAGAGGFAHRPPNDPATPDKRLKINNFYATDWILGRSVVMAGESIIDPANPTPPYSYLPAAAEVGGPNLSPLVFVRSRGGGGPLATVRATHSTCDLAYMSADGFKGKLQRYIAAGGTPYWWELLTDDRFDGYPYPDRPLSAYGLSRTVPVFVRGCTQFIVEYAGDFLGQNAGGQIISSFLPRSLSGLPQGTDGQVDYVIARERVHPSAPLEVVRKVRWYGMPRNTDPVNDTAAGPVIVGGAAGRSDHNSMRDVVPLRDALVAAGVPEPLPLSFVEQFENLPVQSNYAARGAFRPNDYPVYYAAWGPAQLATGGSTPRPKMVRVTLTVDDPNGRLTEGQTFEYVFNLP